MKLYSWHSTLLQQYGEGHIIVVANDPTEARTKALQEFQCWFQDKVSNLFLDDEDYPQKIALIEADIRPDPQEITDGVLFIDGSQ